MSQSLGRTWMKGFVLDEFLVDFEGRCGLKYSIKCPKSFSSQHLAPSDSARRCICVQVRNRRRSQA